MVIVIESSLLRHGIGRECQLEVMRWISRVKVVILPQHGCLDCDKEEQELSNVVSHLEDLQSLKMFCIAIHRRDKG